MPETKKLRVVPAPDPTVYTILEPAFIGPIIVADGPLNYACGDCGTILLQGVNTDTVQSIFIKCGKCGAHNTAMPGGKAAH